MAHAFRRINAERLLPVAAMLTMTAAALAMFRSRRGRARSAWLALMAAVMFLPAAANAACGTLNLPDAHTSPTTSPMASGGTITVTLGALCDAFGLKIGRASGGKECVSTGRSRGSPLH